MKKIGRRVFVDKQNGQGIKRISGSLSGRRSRGFTHKRAKVSSKMQRWFKGCRQKGNLFQRNDPLSTLHDSSLCKKDHIVLPQDEEFYQ